jgi:prolyl-tRNA editing enzyme YbaK/EbsC (Cys-tRNA(Pro) deacylase)
MDDGEKNIKNFLKEKGILAEHFCFASSCHSVREAAKSANISPEEIIKNLCLINTDGDIIIATVRGKDRVEIARVEKALGISGIRIANPQEIFEKTGYPCGGVPSFGCSAKFIIDLKVMEKENVYTGGGSEKSLVRISTKELQKASNGMVARIRK